MISKKGLLVLVIGLFGFNLVQSYYYYSIKRDNYILQMILSRAVRELEVCKSKPPEVITDCMEFKPCACSSKE